MKSVVITAFLLFYHFVIFSQIIPANRLVNWSAAGLSESIPVMDSMINVVTDLGLNNDGSIDIAPAFEASINSAPPGQITYYFPPGTYLFQSKVNVPSNIIIKGSGADSTRFEFDLGGNSGHCFQLAGSQSSAFFATQGSLLKGSSKIFSSAASTFQQGDYLELKQSNGSWDSNPATWATDVVGQIVKVESVIQDTIYIDQALRIDYDTSLSPQIRKIDPIVFSGFECFSIERLDQAPGTSHNFLFSKTANCWLRGVDSKKSNGSHVMITSSTNIEVSDSYFRRAFEYNGASTHGYGVTLAHHAGLCLIENNIFKFLRHAMMVKEGANGNVFAYNYSREPNRSEIIGDFSGDISVHGHYPFANLFEGNIVQNIIIDHYWGPAGPHNTFLRNSTELYGLLMTSGSPNTTDQHFIANDVQGNGFYAITGSGHIEGGNRWQDSIQPYADSLPLSYYLTSKPSFWNLPIPWPSAGEGTNMSKYNNPAKSRYFSNESRAYCCEPTVCSDSCEVPVNLSASFKGGKKVALEWKETSSNSYVLRGRKVGDANWLVIPVSCSSCDNLVFSGLEFTAEYEWQVRSVCGQESSLWSSIHKFSLEELSFCDTPTIHSEIIGSTDAMLSWSAVKDANFYLLLGRKVGTSKITQIILNSGDTTFHATGLSPSTTYEYTVRAVCDSIGHAISDLKTPEVFTTSSPSEKNIALKEIQINQKGKQLVISGTSFEELDLHLYTIDGKLLYKGTHMVNDVISLDAISKGYYLLRTEFGTSPIIIY